MARGARGEVWTASILSLRSALAGLVLACGAAATSAAAQGLAPSPQASILGGVSLPLGNLKNVVGHGYHVQGMIGVTIPVTAFGLRVEGAYHHFGDKTAPASVEGSDVTTSLTAVDATVDLQMFVAAGPARFVRPYLIAGGGVYSLRFKCGGDCADVSQGTQTRTKFGWNAGAGARFGVGSLALEAEGRWVDVRTGLELAGQDVSAKFLMVDLGVVVRR